MSLTWCVQVLKKREHVMKKEYFYLIKVIENIIIILILNKSIFKI